METYIDKNKTFRTDGNQELDKLLFMLESSGVLSEALKSRITNLALWILTNHGEYVTEINEAIKTLSSDMKWVNIFNDMFIGDIQYYLTSGLEYEKLKQTTQKYNL